MPPYGGLRCVTLPTAAPGRTVRDGLAVLPFHANAMITVSHAPMRGRGARRSAPGSAPTEWGWLSMRFGST